MPTKRVILAIIAVALAFGVVVSGCNRNRETRMAQAGKKRQTQTGRKRQTKNAMNALSRKDSRRESRREIELAQAPAVRPAEVLASTVKRPRRPSSQPMQSPVYRQDYQTQPVAIATSYDLARVQEPLPEPIPVSQLYPQTRPAEYAQPIYQAQSYSVPTYDGYAPPVVYHQTPASLPLPPSAPTPVAHPSPELAMARATLSPMSSFSAPGIVPQSRSVGYVPPIEPQMFHAPIPELDPVRYQRVAAAQPRPAPVLMSGPVPAWSASPQSVISEAQPAETRIQGWVSSPTTAMGGARGSY